MGIQFDLEDAPAPLPFTRRPPGPVRRLSAREHPGGQLTLRWAPPAGSTRVAGYRVERTRDGRVFEALGETNQLEFTIAEVPPGEPWFYRVTAFNHRGSRGPQPVYFFRRARRLRPRGPILPTLSFPLPLHRGPHCTILER